MPRCHIQEISWQIRRVVCRTVRRKPSSGSLSSRRSSSPCPGPGGWTGASSPCRSNQWPTTRSGLRSWRGLAPCSGKLEGAVIDPERVLKLAIIHDLAEAETGDSTPYDPAAIPSEHDRRLAAHFLKRVTAVIRIVAPQSGHRKTRSCAHCSTALPGSTRSELGEFWDELHLGTSGEARFVKQIDRLETFLQSRFYLRTDPDAADGVVPSGGLRVHR